MKIFALGMRAHMWLYMNVFVCVCLCVSVCVLTSASASYSYCIVINGVISSKYIHIKSQAFQAVNMGRKTFTLRLDIIEHLLIAHTQNKRARVLHGWFYFSILLFIWSNRNIFRNDMIFGFYFPFIPYASLLFVCCVFFSVLVCVYSILCSIIQRISFKKYQKRLHRQFALILRRAVLFFAHIASKMWLSDDVAFTFFSILLDNFHGFVGIMRVGFPSPSTKNTVLVSHCISSNRSISLLLSIFFATDLPIESLTYSFFFLYLPPLSPGTLCHWRNGCIYWAFIHSSLPNQ